MDFQDLRVFVTVARHGNMSQAAKELNYVQSNVTARIQQLEKELDTSLFDRHGRGVSLTSPGKELLFYAERILSLLEEAEQQVRGSRTPRGSLHIGSTESTAAVRLPELIHRYHGQYPEVDLHLHTGTSEQLRDAVSHRRLDAAFVAGSASRHELQEIPVFQEDLVVVSHRPDPTWLTQDTTLLVFEKGCAYRTQLEKWLEKQGITPRRIVEFGSIDAILGCVRAGMGNGVMIHSLMANHPSSGLHCQPLPSHITD
jgi:LysR family transcriptional regulator, cell division regulator